MEASSPRDIRIKCKGYTPIRDVERVLGVDAYTYGKSACPDVFRGTRIIEVGTSDNAMLTIYFTTSHDQQNNDLDRMNLPVLQFDAQLLGYPFWLVPDSKILFGIDDASASQILRPPLRLRQAGPLDRPGGL